MVETGCSPQRGNTGSVFFSPSGGGSQTVTGCWHYRRPGGLGCGVASGAAMYLRSWKRVTEPSASLVGKFTI